MKLVAFLCALAVGAAPLAHADDGDAAYLSGVQSVGVPAGLPATNAAYGRQLCDRLPAVAFDPLVAAVNQENAGLNMHQSALVIGAAVANFCLERSNLLPQTLPY
ncbi:DUF732 domain-containing protein [Candidatus Mycobacterium wuenschmannii]|uniref:DUF732 domain-containing protein n=1 Tax=Candidatus Mycobacterium wuenschmannii TaxID=3027808 RepID=A0ABY8W1R7_9MYCO|nr:DUF732 domain-containing protein [Candidatus Mycobacterium wuenschmannii]WIM87729.1 DUF732 domain-containing protein [Candidatus Mycobacterium wuenschmannii]